MSKVRQFYFSFLFFFFLKKKALKYIQTKIAVKIFFGKSYQIQFCKKNR